MAHDHAEDFPGAPLALSRRHLLTGAAAAGTIGLSAVPRLARGQTARPVETLGVGSLFNDTLKPIIEKEANVSLTNGPFQSSVDAVLA